ncbi:NnrU family protein [Plastorhodobacter daqingensis]|uniref:NnrU family protein n=1 Tax=Plastorhodobacter daqingensis TaxID=1387281 RepID=A0ABW2UQH2_9RHOB
MIWLILGVLLWSGAHWFKRIAPAQRAAMGNGGKGAVAAAIAVGILLMVIGYRSMDYIHVYAPPTWGVHLTNLLMLAAVALLGAGHSRSRLRGRLRHPMLTGVILWSLSHLLVNGHLAAVILFGGLGLWAIVSIVVINRAEPAPARWHGGSLAGDVRLLIITLVLYAAIAGIHIWLGVWPFPGR